MIRLDQRRFQQLALTGLLSGFVVLILAFAVLLVGLREGERSNRQVDHSYQLSNALGDLALLIERAENARRGYLLSRDSSRVKVYEQAATGVLPQLDRLDALVARNDAQQADLDRLRPLVLAELGQLDASMDLAVSGRFEDAQARFVNVLDFRTLNRIRALSREIDRKETLLLAQRRAEEQDKLRVLRLVLVATGLLLLTVSVATFLLMRRYVADLYASRLRLDRLNHDLEGLVAERTADLQRANDEIQRFAYIVSHDLRSPLVNVLGFTAELESTDRLLGRFLAQLEADGVAIPEPVALAVREDLPEALGFIRTSTNKMDRLINAILALSRQGRRVLAPEPLAMAEVCSGIADSLATLAEERGATIRVVAPMPTIHHDRLAIEQIFSNLMENATKYLEPGRPGAIEVRGAQHGNRVRFEVEDNGRGVAPSDRERIFELFRRAGRQDQAGEGIGLANVRALAHRLGGTVTITSTLSQGSIFIVDLPARFAGEGEAE